MRERLTAEMGKRAERQVDRVRGQLASRCQDDADRAHGIFAAFRRNLQDSLRAVRQSEEEGQEALFTLVTDEQRRQRDRDVRAMEERLDALDEEEAREVAGIQERYQDIRPYVSQVALVFAVAGRDAEQWEQEAAPSRHGAGGAAEGDATGTADTGDTAGHVAAEDSKEAGA